MHFNKYICVCSSFTNTNMLFNIWTLIFIKCTPYPPNPTQPRKKKEKKKN